MSGKRRFHIDERYVTVNLTLSIILYSMVVPFCIYLCVDNYIHGNKVVARYALFCASMTAIATVLFAICKFGKKRRRWLMHLAINIQCFVYWITFAFFLYTGGTGGTSIFLFFLAVPVVFYFFNLSYGLYFNMVFFLIMVVYMNTPLREMGYQFPKVYYSRLPMMYLVNVIMCGIAQYETVKAKIKQDRALDEAKRANEAKTDFLANTSHEIRTPINAVLGMNEMILRESTKAEKLANADPTLYKEVFSKIRHYSGNVDSAGSNLLSIINDILDFSKIEAGKMDIVPVEYQLSSLINDLSNMISFKAKEKNLVFTTDVDETLPDRLYGDVVRVRQVITNILNNAVKYTDSGSVTLKIAGKREGEKQDGKPVIKLIAVVTDTGIGIRKENIEKLFGKFERVDLEKNSTKEGTGLGLAITKMLLEMMNGDVKVESTYGAGSVFTIVIPQVVLAEDPVGDFAEKFEKTLGDKKSYHESFHAPSAEILIVDDTKMNLIVVKEFLKETQLSIDTAGSGKEAVEMADSKKYDVILMDQRMPEMDGEEALHEIRKREDGPNLHTPVICLTADAVVGARERYLSKGFDDYLTKPIDSTSLEIMLKKYIPSEKIESANVESEKEDKSITEENSSQTELSNLTKCGIDTNSGIQNCGGDEAFYRTILHEYVRSSEEKTSHLNAYLNNEDLKDYSILVHALKSTSATIGAQGLAKRASELEEAAAKGNMEFVRTHHETFLNEYEQVLKVLRNMVPENETCAPLSADENEVLEFFPENDENFL